MTADKFGDDRFDYVKDLAARKKVVEEASRYEDLMYSKLSKKQRDNAATFIRIQNSAIEQSFKHRQKLMEASNVSEIRKIHEREAEESRAESNLNADKIANLRKVLSEEKSLSKSKKDAIKLEIDSLQIRNKILQDSETASIKHAQVAREVEERYMTRKQKHEEHVSKLKKDQEDAQKRVHALAIQLEEETDESKKTEIAKQLADAEAEKTKADNAKALQELGDSFKDSLKKLVGKLTDAVDSNLTSLAGYQSGMMARLQGSNSDFDDMVNLVRQNLRGNPLLKQKDVLDNLQKLTDKGIAYDLEQRAFLATVSNKIATTFDALDGTLTRLIRLQQADTTAARLGLEANLTRMLNTMFSDTSYLSDVYDSVSSAILDANSQLSRENSVAFEYTVQKWLGALYSLGASSNMVESIARGINLLGTGDVSALAGNETLQTLLAMSASKAGLPYAELLIDGLDSSETNKLLKGMFEYLKEIAENSDNQVVKAAYGNIFGLSLSDIAAIQNLSQGEIENIFSQTLDYGGAMSELTYQLGQVASRVPLGERIKNVFDNAMFSVASSIFESAPQYVTYMITDAINQVTGGIPIPSPFAFGTGIDLSSFTVEGIIKNAIVGINLLGQIGPILGNMMSSDGTSLWSWGGEPGYNTRGSEFINIRSGAQRSTSSSTYIGSRSSSDMKSSSISSAFEEGNEIKSANGLDEEEFVKAAPALDKGGAELWSKWVNGIAEKFEEKPLAVKIMSAESTIPVVMVLDSSGTGVEANYTMMDLIKAVVDSHDVGTSSFKVSSADNMINQVNGYRGGE